MLYGEKYIYGGVNPFTATDLKMGTYDISITDVYEETVTPVENNSSVDTEIPENIETTESIEEVEKVKELTYKR